jgi:hypothetical protein
MLNWFKNLFIKNNDARRMRDSPDPWVNVVKAHIDPNNPKEGYFELEWNPAFVRYLMAHGYNAPTAEAIVDMWFTELCRNISMDQIADGNFVADAGRVQTRNKSQKSS